MNNEDEAVEDLIRRVEAMIQVVRDMRMHRKLQEYPPGHPEEPAMLKAWREQNPPREHTL